MREKSPETRPALAIGEHFKHLVDHAEMIMAFELSFHLDKIFVQRLKAVSEHLGNVHADRVVRLKEPAPVTYEMEGRGLTVRTLAR